ncbi:MAG TPA: histidine kinase [Solirubrobacteraceae bacterium]|nr:histidine kinase [Solirubrobacteraceae bacterium]
MSTLQWLQLVMGATFVLAGVIAWRCRPGNRTGPIMALYGSTVLAGYFMQKSGTPLVITLGLLIADASAAVFVWLLLAFPSGRLSSRADWLILGPVLFVFGPLEVLWLAFLDYPDNVLLITPDAGMADAVDWVQRSILAVTDTALVVILVRRWVRASPPMRRLLAPVLVGAACLTVGTFALLWDKIAGARTELIAWIIAITFLALPLALLANLLRMRLARSAVGGLIVDLRRDGEPSHLQTALRRALGDPSLTIAFWLPEYDTYADLSGNELTLPEEGPGVAITVLERGDGSRVAALIHDPSLAQQGDLLREVAAVAAMAVENARLQAELRANLDELRGSRARVIEAADSERRRLERDLHDGAQQRLVTLAISLTMLENRLAGDPETRALVAEAKREAADSLQELRDLAHGIHPAVLTSHGLTVALESLAANVPLPVGLDVELPERLPPATEVAAYYLICEGLANTIKHAHARTASVAVHRDDGFVVVEVDDDGVGGADTAGGSGLRGLADRVEALDGSLQVSSPTGEGTHLRAEIPCVSS